MMEKCGISHITHPDSDRYYMGTHMKNLLLIIAVSIFFSGCTTIPADALKLNETSLEDREMQTRIYEGVTEEEILSACVGIVQDLGFTIIESETDLGLLVGEKQRSAVEPGQVAAAVAVALLGGGSMPIDNEQDIHFSIVTMPVKWNQDDNRYFVRATVQRIVRNTNGQVSKIEGIRDPEIFREFFEKLDKSLFLEKNT